MMRVLVLLAALLSMPALAADETPWPDADASPAGIQLLAQATSQGSQQQSGSQRHPGDYCTRHCRPTEIPCGDGCMVRGPNAKCMAKKTTTCGGKP